MLNNISISELLNKVVLSQRMRLYRIEPDFIQNSELSFKILDSLSLCIVFLCKERLGQAITSGNEPGDKTLLSARPVNIYLPLNTPFTKKEAVKVKQWHSHGVSPGRLFQEHAQTNKLPS